MAAKFRVEAGNYAIGGSVNSCYQGQRDYRPSPGAQKSLPGCLFFGSTGVFVVRDIQQDHELILGADQGVYDRSDKNIPVAKKERWQTTGQ
jgi:hypothetical protein